MALDRLHLRKRRRIAQRGKRQRYAGACRTGGLKCCDALHVPRLMVFPHLCN